VNPTLPVESPKTWHPHLGQNFRVTVLPLVAVLLCSASAPDTLMPAEGKMAFAVPLPAMYWQSRHQHNLEMTGSAVI
jgi:hypothetical protein